MQNFDVVVVGLGATGSAAMFHLARAGVQVLGVDRYVPPHAMGSSHGDTRITRRAVGEGSEYIPFVSRSHTLWRELEDASGESLLVEVGALIMAPEGTASPMHGSADFMGSTTAVAEQHDIPHEIISADDVRRRFPQFHLEGEYLGYFEPGAGYVRAEAAVRAHIDVAEEFGATVRLDERVVGVEQAHGRVVVTTDKARYSATTVVLAVGSWLPELLPPDLAGLFTVYRQILIWFETSDTPLADGPVFIWQFGPGTEDVFYGFPAIDGPSGGLKVGSEMYGSQAMSDIRRAVGDDEIASTYQRCVHGRLPGVGSSAVRSARCLYTVTPDYGFVIDRHPELPGVIVASPCSGHGFKHSPAVGEAVAQLAVGAEPVLDVQPFSFGRFKTGRTR